MSGGKTFVVIGGGVAGVTCAEELCRLCSKDDQVVLLSSQKVVKKAVVVESISDTLEDVRLVVEKGEEILGGSDSIQYVACAVKGLDPENRLVVLDSGESIRYDDVCICTGASPRRILGSDCVVTLRDTDSILSLCKKLDCCKSMMVVGNGGIALDVVAAFPHVETHWVVKHESIGDAFFDAEVGQFLLEDLEHMRQHAGTKTIHPTMKRGKGIQETAPGASVGPKWTQIVKKSGIPENRTSDLHIERSCEVLGIDKSSYDSKKDVRLSNGKTIRVDIIISAIGVDPAPNISFVPESVLRASDGGIQVSHDMKSSHPHIYAAGDACTVIDDPESLWFQMRLWSQARSMGLRAAHCMLNVHDQMASDLPFEIFLHVTHFLGKRVIFLVCFNGQKLEDPKEDKQSICFYSRILGKHPERNFVRVVLKHGRIKGAICIGETGLEETLENLIMDGIDVSSFGPHILDPDCDLDDIFD